MDNATTKYVFGVAHVPGNGQFPTSRHTSRWTFEAAERPSHLCDKLL